MSGTRLILPRLQFFDEDGTPLTGGKINTYEAGTTTPLATYSDSALSVANANPVVLDSEGRTPDIYGDPDTAYKIVLTKSDGSVIWTADNIYFGGQVGTGNIEDSSVTTAKIADSNVTAAKLSVAGGSLISVSSNDTTPGVLNGKLVAGTGIDLTEGSDGGDETLTVDSGNLLDSDLTDENVTGTTVETDLNTYTLPGGTLNAGDGIRVCTLIENINIAAVNNTISFYFGSNETALNPPELDVTGDFIFIEALVFNVSAAVQRIVVRGVLKGTGGTVEEPILFYDTAAENSASDVIIKFTLTPKDNADSTTQRMFWTEIIRAA